ncbi:hypothetical protein JCM33374_g498 [Metschnikowia sp. JCM 33374]|nr:hypothetical protein JCM33374_g498 [Metschnikowia sp. JCM 33374]
MLQRLLGRLLDNLPKDPDVEFAEDIAKNDIANDNSKGIPTESARDVAAVIANTPKNTSKNISTNTSFLHKYSIHPQIPHSSTNTPFIHKYLIPPQIPHSSTNTSFLHQYLIPPQMFHNKSHLNTYLCGARNIIPSDIPG